MTNPVLIIAGPTASGKSALALDLAEEFTGTIINADSMQVYGQLDILSARPSGPDLKRAPHRLYGVMDAAESCSAGRWRDMAAAEIEAAWKARRLPLVVGGTGLYLKALIEGLSPIPEIPAAVREQATELLDRLGETAFHEELAKRDPEMAARLPMGDRQRRIRAFEVALATDRCLSDWQKQPLSGSPVAARYCTIVVLPERQILYDRIDARFEHMVEHGALEEVRDLLALDLDPALPVLKALGVPELGRYLDGECDLDTAMDDGKRATRNFAKRQLTWLRHQMKNDLEIHAQYSESLRPKIFSFIRQFLLTDPS